MGVYFVTFFFEHTVCISPTLWAFNLNFYVNMDLVYLIRTTLTFIGEGMSGFIPSLAALAQGVSGNPECSNGTIIHVEDQVFRLPYQNIDFQTLLIGLFMVLILKFMWLYVFFEPLLCLYYFNQGFMQYILQKLYLH